MRSWWRSVALVASGCGRVAFNPLGTAGDAPAGFATPQLVSLRTNVSTTSATIPVPVPAVAAGNLLVVLVGTYDTTAVVASVADDSGANTYASANARSSSPDAHTEIWYAAHAEPGATQLTVTLTSPLGGSVWLAEFSGIAAAAPLDTAGIGNAPASATIMAPTVVTMQPDELVTSAIVISNGGVSGIAAGNPFIPLQDINGDSAAYTIAVAPGGYGAVWNMTGGGTVCASTAAFLPAPL